MNETDGICVIFGGAGYVGQHWADRLVAKKMFRRILLADGQPPATALPPGVEFIRCDVRQPIGPQLPTVRPDWIFNFAAVHREPGHAREEYFDTNLPGARNVCDFAEKTDCPNILFTSSIAVYGPTNGPTSETSPLYPNSPYGISKLAAELIHEAWRVAGPQRRLLICRPAVVYGPGDPGNILRLIRAIQTGHFVFPGSKTIRKSYAYIEGLLDSFEFALAQPENRLVYNYAERETETLEGLVRLIQRHLNRKVVVFTAPLSLLVAAAKLAQLATGGRSPLHPARVRKATLSTHIVPETLIKAGFNFRYDFAASLQDWATKAPEDFSPKPPASNFDIKKP
jgi:nucleoside-diphosphate-sugar epimerase